MYIVLVHLRLYLAHFKTSTALMEIELVKKNSGAGYLSLRGSMTLKWKTLYEFQAASSDKPEVAVLKGQMAPSSARP